MKKLLIKSNLFLCLLLLLVTASFGQAQKMKGLIKTVVTHAKEASLYQKNLDWIKLEAEINVLTKDAKTIEDLTPAFNHLLAELKDFHGRIIYKGKPIASWSRKPTGHQKTIKPAIWNVMQTGKYSLEAKLLNDKIGYIRIGGMPMGDNVKMSREIRDAVCSLKSKKAEKWIIDLRYNSGGNMYPMFEGIAEILGEGIVAATQDPNGTQISTWKIKDANFYYDEYRAVDLPNRCSFETLPKVAVLTSVYTASSGEAVAVAFKNRPKTKFFGGKTSGYTTVTDWTELDKELFMTISTSYYADRSGVPYRDYVDVDVPTKFFMPEEFSSDEAIIQASIWLTKKDSSNGSKDRAELLRLHKEHQTAHLSYNAELFVESFAENVTQLQRGYIKTQDKAANLKRFKNYFANYKFIEWEDIKPPVIKISNDGTLATIIVEKSVKGTYKNEKGLEEKDHSIFAWLEVWEKIGGKWKITTIASTARYGKN